jgi:hypothetical protein
MTTCPDLSNAAAQTCAYPSSFRRSVAVPGAMFPCSSTPTPASSHFEVQAAAARTSRGISERRFTVAAVLAAALWEVPVPVQYLATRAAKPHHVFPTRRDRQRVGRFCPRVRRRTGRQSNPCIEVPAAPVDYRKLPSCTGFRVLSPG